MIPDLVQGLGSLEVARWLAFVPRTYNERDAQAWIDACATLENDHDFAIELLSENRVLGGTSVVRIIRLHGIAGGGIWLSAAHQGQGYGREAFGERIRFAFEDLGLRMRKRFGYRPEGIRRQAFRCLVDGQLKDEVLMGRLREEWTP